LTLPIFFNSLKLDVVGSLIRRIKKEI
jgi:hypothetical protein